MEENKVKSNIFVKFSTIFQAIGWSLIFFLTLMLIYYEIIEKDTESLKVCIIQNLKIFQTLQSIEIFFAFLKLAGGSPIFTTLQILGRIIVTYCFIELEMNSSIICNVITCWSLAEIFRNMYYLTKNNFFGFLR